MSWLRWHLTHNRERAEFLNLKTTDILDWVILCCGSYSVHCRMFSHIPDFYSIHVINILPFFLLSILMVLQLFFFLIYFYFWLCWVLVSVRGLPLVVASGGHSSSRCAGLSLLRPLLLRSTGSRRAGSVVVAHGPSCSAVCGIFPDQGSNPCSLHWQADSQPLRHQGSPILPFWQPKMSPDIAKGPLAGKTGPSSEPLV